MAYHALVRQSIGVVLLVALAVAGCSSSSIKQARSPRSALDAPVTAPPGNHDPFVGANLQEMKPQPPLPGPKLPEFQPVTDNLSPARTRLVNIQARNSALGDILHVIAETAGLNLIINEGVQQDRAITISLKRVPADEALATVLGAADYFHVIKDNTITVDAVGTKTFELGHPAMVQGFAIEVGGDILGSGSSLSAGSSTSSSNMKGTISQTIKHDTKAFDFWESLEQALQGIIGKTGTASARSETMSQSTRTSATGAVTTSQTKTTVERPVPQIAPTPVADAATGEESGPKQQVVINRLTGTIMVTATRKNLLRVESWLDTLRTALNRQVLIEARVIEVQLDDSFKYGIDWNVISRVRGFAQLGGGFGASVSTSNLSAAVAGGAPGFRVGAVQTGDRSSIGTLLTALKSQGEVKTLSNPRVNVMNGQTAILSVGRNTNYIAKVTSTTTTASGSTPTVTYTVDTGNVLSGIMMGLVPYINKAGEISLTVTPIVSNLVELKEEAVGGDVDNQIKIKLPTVDLRELSTTVKVRNGEMIVIGGLISNLQQTKDEKIPLLGDMPGLGWLFTRKDNVDTRSELVVVLQPYLLSND